MSDDLQIQYWCALCMAPVIVHLTNGTPVSMLRACEHVDEGVIANVKAVARSSGGVVTQQDDRAP